MDASSSANTSSTVQRVTRTGTHRDNLLDEYVLGTPGDDQLYGGKGNDWLSGGAGIDTWIADRPYSDLRKATLDPVTGLRTFEMGNGSVTLESVEFIRFNDVLVAADDPLLQQRVQTSNTAQGVSIVGTDLPVALTGGKGSDTLQGNGGDDALSGGYDGVDTAVYRGPRSEYVLGNDAQTGFVTITDQVPGRDGRDTLSSIEVLQFSDGAQLLNLRRIAMGSAADETLPGLATPTEFFGLGGDDVLAGRSTDVAVYRGPRSDYVIERSSLTAQVIIRDLVADRDGTDTIQGLGSLRFADGTVPYEAPPLKRQVNGTAAADMLFGGEDDQLLMGLAGDDFLDGAAGSDTAVFRGPRSDYRIEFNAYSPWAQVVDGVAGRDGRDTLRAVEWLRFADGTIALDLRRTITGTARSEQLDAGEGDQTLVGLGGNDQLLGGNGIDTAVFSGPMAEYRASYGGQLASVSDTVAGRDGRDALSGIEWLQFADRTVSFNDYFAASMQAWIDQFIGTSQPNWGGVAYASSGPDFEDGMALEAADAAEGDLSLAGQVNQATWIELTALP